MRNIYPYVKNIGFGLLTVFLVGAIATALITHRTSNITSKYPFFNFLANNHILIMVILIILSVGYGVLLATISMSELRKQTQQTKNAFELVMQFLAKEEQVIIAHLVASKGQSTQADISRLPTMNRVRAHRLLQKLEEKQLLDVTSHGKIRKVALKSHILESLK